MIVECSSELIRVALVGLSNLELHLLINLAKVFEERLEEIQAMGHCEVRTESTSEQAYLHNKAHLQKESELTIRRPHDFATRVHGQLWHSSIHGSHSGSRANGGSNGRPAWAIVSDTKLFNG